MELHLTDLKNGETGVITFTDPSSESQQLCRHRARKCWGKLANCDLLKFPKYIWKRIKNFAGKLIVCFFINWGDTVSVRYLSELIDNAYLRPPRPPVYDVVPISMELDQVQKMTMFYLKHVGKSYDYTRAILSLFPFTLRETTLDRFYCAQLVMHSLKAAGMEFDVNMDHVSPLCVHTLLKNIKS